MGATRPVATARARARLSEFDYGRAGAYFITICTHERALLFEDDRLASVASQQWLASADLRLDIALDMFVVMPNHIHGIVWIDGRDEAPPANPARVPRSGVGAQRAAPKTATPDEGARSRAAAGLAAPQSSVPSDRPWAQHAAPLLGNGLVARPRRALGVAPGSLGAFVRAYKSAVTREVNLLRGTSGAPVWQRNYYDHVIRDQQDLDRIREYIQQNPLRWHLDHDNPEGAPDNSERAFWAIRR